MYLDFYRLKQAPFHITPDPHFLFLSPSHKAALGTMIYGIDARQGFVAVTGEVGLGKTTIVRAYLERVDTRQLRTICIFNANITFPDLLQVIAQEFGLPCPADDPFSLVNQLHKVLINEYQQGRNVALLIDEAQNMPIETLEHLRMLSNLETATQKLLQIVLIGQPELDHKLNRHELRQLKQRIVLHVTIAPLTEEQSWAYVYHRLERASLSDEPIFTKQALKMLIKAAKGTPRVLNTLCSNALITGFGYQQKPVTHKVAREVIADLQGQGQVLSPRRRLVYVAVAILLAGLFWLSPYRDLVLAKVKGFDAFSALLLRHSVTHREAVPASRPVAAPRSDSNLPLEAAPSMPLTTATPPAQEQVSGGQPESVLSVEEELENGELPTPEAGADAPPPPPAAFPRVVSLQKGDSISKMALEMYGFINPALMERIRHHNPHIKNINRVTVGEEILLPAFPAVHE
jgi:general secretion pathway protein A